MQEATRVYLLAYMLALAATIPATLAFNINVRNPGVYSGEQKDFFGYKVLQVNSSGDKGIIITAPLRLNGSGGVCKQVQGQNPKWFSPDESSKMSQTTVKHLGLSIAADSGGSQFTVCSPSVAHECYENSYLNSICYKVTDQLQQASFFKPQFQECTKKTVNLVFLFDGSASMTEDEFNKNKDFILEIMDSLKNSSIKFAAVQFSQTYRKVFDFNDYSTGGAEEKLRKEPHMKSLTNTYKALTFVLGHIFDNTAVGASPDATKVLVMITDGDPSDLDRNGTVTKYNEKSIIRLVIGVKGVKLDKFKKIVSEPQQTNFFQIEEYNGLTSNLEKFQKKLFTMEGSKVVLAENMTNEMSQSGFSAVYYKDTLILGSVGSNAWRGTLQERREQKETPIEDPEMEMDSYMGYSISVGERNGVGLYFSGAPRFEHAGQVVLFKHDGKNWTAAQRIRNNQIGSYFGAELCSVDVNSDGNIDFLLVGAPLFYQSQEKKEGCIYIYSLSNKLHLKHELNVMAPSMGRFGTAISSLADLNGDGLRDVAAGAPLADDNGGVVYIYLGDKHKGIRSTFSQEIRGKSIKPGIRFFGQAIDGNIDLSEDGLPDIVVGSQGFAVVLSSKPVFNVVANMSFKPKEISTEKLDSLKIDKNTPIGDLSVCFEIKEATKSKLGVVSAKLNISYTVNVDPMRQAHRGFFSDTDKKARNVTATEIIDKNECFIHSIYMTKNVKDTLSPLSIKLNFSQSDFESSNVIINEDSQKHFAIEVPFEKQCRKQDTCIAELVVDFNYTAPELLVREENYINVIIRLVNEGDDSFNTSLTMHYPLGLSFSMMTLVKEPSGTSLLYTSAGEVLKSRMATHSCNDMKGVYDETVCGVSRPVYRSKSWAKFNTSFRIDPDYEWNNTISMTISAKSENANSTATKTKSIPVRFEIKMALTVSDDTITYLNFTTEDPALKRVDNKYRIDNTGFKDFPVNVTLFFPPKLSYEFEMSNYHVSVEQNKTKCTRKAELKSKDCPIDTDCVAIMCDSFILESNTGVEFTLSGDMQFKNLQQYGKSIPFFKRYTGDSADVKFLSVIDVNYDEGRYALDSHKQGNKDKDHTVKQTELRVELIVLPDQKLIILTGTGLGFLLLIIIAIVMFKLGCFKRKTLQYYQEQEEEDGLQDLAPVPTNGAINQSESDKKPDEQQEKTKFLDDIEANGSPMPDDILKELE
ncbi:integrin alpha-M [Pholidichthys leucotaenia]